MVSDFGHFLHLWALKDLHWVFTECNRTKATVYAIYFAYRYFRDFSQGQQIPRDFMIFYVFITINSHVLKLTFSRGLTLKNKTTTKITTYTVIFNPYLGHLLWSLQPMKGISIGNEKVSAIPHYSTITEISKQQCNHYHAHNILHSSAMQVPNLECHLQI